MKTKLLLVLTLLGCLSPSLAQDTSVPESVRRMIEQSQASSQYEQMARMQIQVQYREFLDALSGDAGHKTAVENALVAVLSERAELSARVASGQASTAELTNITDYAWLRERLAPLLSASELSALDNRSNAPSANQIKQQYAAELTRLSSSLTAADQDVVLDTLVKHLQTTSSDATLQLSVDELVSEQMRSFMQASTELQDRFSGEKLQEVLNFINQLQGNLYRNRSMTEVTQ